MKFATQITFTALIKIDMNIRKLFFILSFLLVLAGCSKDDVIPPSQGENPGNEPYVPYTPSPAVEGRAVIAYVAYYGTTLPDPNIVTHINYAFAELYMKDGEYLGFKPQGKLSRFESVVALKQKNPNLKILLSFCNNVSNSDNLHKGDGFSVLAKSEQMRKAFAQDCREWCEKYGIDGIDLDWEFPGLSWSSQAVDLQVDVENHVLLMKDLREALGNDYLLTYAGYVMDKKSYNGGYRYIDIKALDSVVDYVNLMTYDMDEGSAPHNAMSASGAYWDILRTYTAYIAAGATPSKLVLGIPFYGRVSFSGSPGALSYKSIRKLVSNSAYTIENWDASASVPYVTYNGSRYCYYDNPRSIELKAKWALERNFYGLMYWENDSDDENFTLRRATWESVMN